MGKLTIFLHMPKTGGTTLNQIVRRVYDDDSLYATPDVITEHYGDEWWEFDYEERWQFARDSFADLPESEKQNLDAVLGHLWFGWHELTDRSCQYVTFLRNPVHRTISAYNYNRDRDNKTVGGFEEFLEESFSSNFQTKFLTGNFSPDPESLEQAIQNIENHFLLVGLTEHYDEDLIHLSELLGWSFPYYNRANTSEKHVTLKDLDAGTISKIIEVNELDISLYKYVTMNRSDRNHQFRARAFQMLNNSYSTARKVKNIIS